MSLIAGFFVWIFDTWKNKEEFPRPFVDGLREGFWWGIVSMTTVGYGDKTPKSHMARLFAVIWFLIGIIVCAIYVGSISSDIMASRIPDKPEISGKKVGALKGRMPDALMIAQHGGRLHEMEFNETVHGIVDLMKALRSKEIDGFVLSRPTYYYFKRTDFGRKYKEDVRDVTLTLTETNFQEDKYVAGMLVKNVQDYTYLRMYFESNWPNIQGCYLYEMNYKYEKFHNEEENTLSGLFIPFLVGSLVLLVVILCFGAVYEFIRRKCYPVTEACVNEVGGV